MDDSDYPGIRIMMEATIGKARIPMKIDFSTDDAITPHAILFSLPLMFEDRTISLRAYNTETVLAEKLETIVSRGTLNTRMRDFYDIFALSVVEGSQVDYQLLNEAFNNTAKKRNTDISNEVVNYVLEEVRHSAAMEHLWGKYQKEFDYAEDIEWRAATDAVEQMIARIREGFE